MSVTRRAAVAVPAVLATLAAPLFAAAAANATVVAPKALTQHYGPTAGAASYAVPAGARFVSPSGSDSNPGTLSAPWRTVGHAVNSAGSGSTIVLRAGTYHEDVNVPSMKVVHLQNYPGESVWFDGAQSVSGFAAASGGGYVRNNWTTQFDHTNPTAGATDTSFQMVSSAYPMAAWPDMVFFDGKPLAQVQYRSQVAPGKFFVDYTNHQLFLGDNPSGHRVEASTLAEALFVNHGNGSSVKGIGFKRYACNLSQLAAVKGWGDNLVFENDRFDNNAVGGLYVKGTNVVVRNSGFDANGQLGFGAVYSDHLTFEGNEAQYNNLEHFKTAPVAGGVKVTRSQYDTYRANNLSNNYGTGIWLDESTYQQTVVNNLVQNNQHHGIHFEISAQAIIAGNIVTGSADNGIYVADSSNAKIYNNTLAGNARDIELADGPRVSTNMSIPGHDPRHGYDPNISWVVTGITLRNNLLAGARGADLLGVDDYTHVKSYKQMATSDNNGYYRASTASTPRLAHLANYPSTSLLLPANLTALRGYGYDVHGVGVDNVATNPFFVSTATNNYALTSTSIALGKGAALPTDVAAAMGATAGVAVNIGAL